MHLLFALLYKNADYVTSLGRLVASRYADGLFPRVYRAEDGTAYNVSGSPLEGQACDALLRSRSGPCGEAHSASH